MKSACILTSIFPFFLHFKICENEKCTFKKLETIYICRSCIRWWGPGGQRRWGGRLWGTEAHLHPRGSVPACWPGSCEACGQSEWGWTAWFIRNFQGTSLWASWQCIHWEMWEVPPQIWAYFLCNGWHRKSVFWGHWGLWKIRSEETEAC